MEDAAGWVALVATCTAAIMTASNLGSRVTGWGFVVFSLGSVAWITVALLSGQTQLLWSNIFLTLVNVVGVWRWLGHRARVDDSAAAAVERSAESEGPRLFAATALDGMTVVGRDGAKLGQAVEAMAGCRSGAIDYLIVSAGGVGGVGETLHKLPWREARIAGTHIEVDLDAAALGRLPIAERAV